jgi:hypothetical protein
MEAIYPKEDPEYDKKVKEAFYKRVKDTRWNEPSEIQSKPRGRKPKQVSRPEAKPRSEGEKRAAENKFFNFK